MSLGEFKGLEFVMPDGTAARVDGLEIDYKLRIITDSGDRRMLRSTVDIVDKRLRGVVELIGGDEPLTHENMDLEDLRGSLSDVLYWLMNADMPDEEN